jgi:hypothetical protein
MAVDLTTYDGVKAKEDLLRASHKQRLSVSLLMARVKAKPQKERAAAHKLVSDWKTADSLVTVLEYDTPRLEVELQLARLKGSKGLVEVNEGLIKQTAERLAEWKPKLEKATVALIAELGEIP